ncbi:uncharacterized protein LOC116337216 [Contarinia nasturtii]|uniref:uncharacterized protein LOC116337216 n=1 Tax=Contarinia nasturtii TaxID=265458 RepID=UPI0012D4057D|nr:uncharacterized protein LOC116337216 [Contarinia nasturtii]
MCYSLPLFAIVLGLSSVLPNSFVYLSEVDTTIIQNFMYYGDRNFIGHRLSGYKAPKVILTKEAALRLKDIQADIKKDNFPLVIYDGYRRSNVLGKFNFNRGCLSTKMMAFDFYPFDSEWWHFTLTDEPFENTFFDFDIE